MMRFALALAVSLLFTALPVSAAEFPTGELISTGFKVEKGDRVITHMDMHRYEAKAQITTLDAQRVEFILNGRIWRLATSSPHVDQRRDVFQVTWDSETSGRLVNENKQYTGDRSTFTINDGLLTIKSWISRNQLWETQYYKIP